MNRSVLVCAFFILSVTSARAWQTDVELRSEIFNDNDASHSLAIEEVAHYKNTSTRFGLGASQNFLHESGSSRKYYGGLLEGYHKEGQFDLSGQIRFIERNGKGEWPAKLAASQQIGRLRIEGDIEQAPLDSVKAFDARIDFLAAGLSADYSLSRALSLNAGYWYRWSSDNNERQLVVGRATYSYNDNFHLQYRYRGIRNQEQVSEYYSPENFDQHALLFGYFDSFIDRIRLKAWIGPVIQNDGFERSLGMFEDVSLFCRINDHWSLTARVEADQVGNGYEYIYSTLSAVYDF